MSLADHLVPDAVLVRPQARDKWSLIAEMVEALAACGRLPSDRVAEARQALEDRERSVSTGMEQGIAVPHAALDDLDGVVAGLAVMPQGVDFQSLDGQPARIIVLLLVPRAEKVTHVRTLTEVARRLGDARFRDALLSTDDAEQLVHMWS